MSLLKDIEIVLEEYKNYLIDREEYISERRAPGVDEDQLYEAFENEVGCTYDTAAYEGVVYLLCEIDIITAGEAKNSLEEPIEFDRPLRQELEALKIMDFFDADDYLKTLVRDNLPDSLDWLLDMTQADFVEHYPWQQEVFYEGQSYYIP